MDLYGNPDPRELSALIALLGERRYEEAISVARMLTSHFPSHPFAWKAWGVALKQLGRGAEALVPAQRAVIIAPGDAEAQNNLGATLRDLGHFTEAMACVQKALQIRPVFAEAHLNLGNVLTDLEDLDGAIEEYRRSIEIKPDYAVAHSSLGHALTKLGRCQEAVTSCRRALELAPRYVGAHNNLGLALHDLGRLGDAVASYRRALEVDFANVDVHNNLGAALRDLGCIDEAAATCRRALELRPEYVLAHINLGHVLQDLGKMGEAIASYGRALELKPDCLEAHDNLLFDRLYEGPVESRLKEARYYGEVVAQKARRYGHWPNVPDADRRLRVGLVSGDLGSHPVGFFLESILPTLVADFGTRLEFFAYPSYLRRDAVAERIKACCREWHPAVGLSDERLAQRIREDAVDILIDLSGHTAHNRLPMFAWKPAPVQVTWLGYLATTGVAAIDYLIADRWTLPEREKANFTEKIWYLPETYLCFRPDVDLPIATQPMQSNGYITFGCFNNLNKMNDAVVALWSKILQRVPGSRLFLKTGQLDHPANRERVKERFAAEGVEAARLILEGAVPRAELLSSYGRMDIALDPFPYPGITSTVEALWMGVPVLTLAGSHFLSRQGVGILMNVGMPEWIAAEPEDYVTKAVMYSADLASLSQLRSGLRSQILTSPLMDAGRFAAHFEEALGGMWSRWCASGNQRAF